MKTSRTSRLLTVIVAIFGMLFMQLAVAAYACPGNQNHVPSATVMAADMANCDGTDPAQSTLCHAHAQSEPARQSLDKSFAPDVPPFVPVVLVSDLKFFDLVVPAVLQPPPPVALTRTSAPPIAIRNCCFRI